MRNLYVVFPVIAFSLFFTIPYSFAETSIDILENLTTILNSRIVNPDDNSLRYKWTQTGGEHVTLSSYSVAKPKFRAPEVADDQIKVLTFTVTVSGSNGLIKTDTIKMTVYPIIRPVVNTENQDISKNTIDTSTDAYKDHAYSIKTHYYNLKNELNSGLTTAESIISSSPFENSEAKQKKDTAQKIRSKAWTTNLQIISKLNQVEDLLNNRHYNNAYNKLLEIDNSGYSLKEDLYTIIKEMRNAQSLEKQYQESQKTCMLFWCSGGKDTYNSVNSKIQDLESKLKTIESKLSQIESEKNKITQSIHKFELDQKSSQIEKLESIRKQEQYESQRQEQILQEQIRQKQLESERQAQLHYEELKRQELQRQLEQQAYERDLAYKEQQRQQQENEKIRQIAERNPVLKGLLDGVITFYIAPVPNYADSYVSKNMDVLTNNLVAKSSSTIKFVRVYNQNEADISVNWVKNYEVHAGVTIFNRYIIVGLGSDTCANQWQPLDAKTIYYIVWHEIGHSLGFNHSSDPNNVMYPTTPYYRNALVLDDWYNIDEGEGRVLSLCGSGISGNGKFYYEISTNNQQNGFDAYVVDASTNPNDFIHKNIGSYYKDCSTSQNMISFSNTCTVERGSKLIIYNKNDLLKFNSIDVHVKIFDNTSRNEPSTYWNPKDFAYSEEFLQYIVNSYGK